MLSTNQATNHSFEQNNDIKSSNDNDNNNNTMFGTGSLYCRISLTYRDNQLTWDAHHGYSLVNRGANGGVSGSDVRVIKKPNRTLSLSSLDN